MREDANQLDPSTPIIDTHLHLWDLDKFRLPWLAGEEVQAINRSFLMKDYLEDTQGLNVVKAVYMEVDVHPEQQVQEAEYVVDLCQREDNPIAAAILGGSPQSSNFAPMAERFAGNPYVRGFRTVLHDAARPKGTYLEPQFVENIKLLGKLGLRFELCMRPEDLLESVRLVEQCPRTQFILDHCGCLDAQSTEKTLRENWESAMLEMAQHENVALKISGIVASASENWQPEDLASNMEFCIDTFGDQRVCFGGDWPVCKLRASFKQWVDALGWIVRDKPLQFAHQLFHDNAVKIYAL